LKINLKSILNKWIKVLARLYLPVYKYESETMKIAFAGYSSIKRSYCARLLLGKESNHTSAGYRFFWAMPKMLKSCDVVVSEISPLAYNKFQKYNGFIMPVWATMRINIDRPLSEITKITVSDFSNVMRRIRKYNLSYEILNDKESFDLFYNRFYLPYTSVRHGEEALIEDLSVFWNSLSSRSIMAVKEDNMIVAAALISRAGDSFNFMRLGLLDGNEEYRKHGVIGALYYFGIVEGQKTGYKYFDVGGTRPFLSDGLTKYKMGLCAEFVQDHSFWKEYLWFGFKKDSAAAQDFLNANPFMHIDGQNRLVRYEVNEGIK